MYFRRLFFLTSSNTDSALKPFGAFLIVMLVFSACGPKPGNTTDGKAIEKLSELAKENIGDDFICELNQSQTFSLCNSKNDPTGSASPLVYFIYDVENSSVIFQDRLNRGHVNWISDSLISVQTIPGVYEEGKEMEDYRTELNIFELLRKNAP